MQEITINQFIKVIGCLPSDKPINNPRKWYKTQKEHWLGWLSEYDGPGAYGRKCEQKRNAEYAYNHIMCPEMLLYLIKALRIKPELAKAVEEYQNYDRSKHLAQTVAAIRKIAPWWEISQAILDKFPHF